MCTRILWNTNGVVTSVGRTMDWAESTEPKLYIFPRGISRDGGRFRSLEVVDENPAKWTSKYGSVIISAYGLASVDGVNEAGFGMHLLFLAATDFGPRDPDKAGVHAGLWGQYLLDNASTVEEALRLMKGFQPVMVEHGGFKSSLHLAVAGDIGEPDARKWHVRIGEGPRVNEARLEYCGTTTGNRWQTVNTNPNLNRRDLGLLAPSARDTAS